MFANRMKEFANNRFLRNRKCSNVYNHSRLNDFPKTYEAKDVQNNYKVWMDKSNGQSKEKNQKNFTMILPPPNVTGTLHLGHALTTTVQDCLVKWNTMKGLPSIWIPGFDHAGIATQTVVEKYLSNVKKIKKSDMTRHEFVNLINGWKDEKRKIIRDQLNALGASLDWDREYFTLSRQHNQAVNEAFVRLNEKNLLYRDKSLINWCTALGSTLSDIEVELEYINGRTDIPIPGYSNKVTFGQIFEISYCLKDSKEKISIATTRPETLMGDVALAVHPDDERYGRFIGQKVKHPLQETYLPVIAHENVQRDFGTGIVKITPGHDRFDYEVAKSANLEIINIIDESGKLTEKAGRYAGMQRFIAKKNIVDYLLNTGSLVSVKDHPMQIPKCSRTGDVIELLLKDQWFVRCNEMAKRAYEIVEKGLLKLDPSSHNQTWFDWLNETSKRDWCVSRQIWWGHQVPAYYCTQDSSKWIIASNREKAMKIAKEKFGSAIEIIQDNDVLDTWFSSALLPFSSLGWPEKTPDYKNYYPLNLMETGHDILFFWVARMVMLGLELTDQLPFKEVLLHGVLCDANGKKMSKSSGNVIFPENVINGITLKDLNDQANESFSSGLLSQTELKRTLKMNKNLFPNGIPECGVDALRLTLLSHVIKKPFVSFDVMECQQNKFFCNKIWQASRYVLLMTEGNVVNKPETFTTIDVWILSRLSWMVTTVNEAFEQKEFNKAVSAIKQFVYYEFCDYFVEGTKPGFLSKQQDITNSHRYTLTKCLEVSLRAMAPITPHLSDSLYSKLSEKLSLFTYDNSLLRSSYPDTKEMMNLRNIDLENKMNQVIQVVLSLRALNAHVSNKSGAYACIVVRNLEDKELFEQSKNIITAVSKLTDIRVVQFQDFEHISNIISESLDSNLNVHLVIKDEAILKNARDSLERKRQKAQKKLEILVKKTKTSNYNADATEEQKLKDNQQISSLKGDLKRIPMSS